VRVRVHTVLTGLTGLAALLLSAVLLSACGYRVGSLVPSNHSTIAVPIFENTTERHDLEWEVTRAVVEELQSRSHLLVVSERDNPDLVLNGALVRVDEDILSRRKRQRPRENVLFLTAEITVTDPKTGQAVLAKKRVTERESFTPMVGESIRSARQEAVRTLAERVVQALEEGF